MRGLCLCLGMLVALAGCSGSSSAPRAAGGGATAHVGAAAKLGNFKNQAADQEVNALEQPAQAPQAPAAKEDAPRKIVYTATVELVVEDFDQATQELTRLLKEQGGYFARSDITGLPGTPRTGTWTVRVPVEHFDAFRDALVKLGEGRVNKTDSDDITDRYYDLKAHLKNKQQEEDRLLDHLKKSTANLTDILTVEKELSRVRGEIEQMQGQIQRWDKESALATLTVILHDRKDYVPPVSADYGTTLGRTFNGSLEALVTFGKGVLLVLVAVAPWAVVLAVIGVPVWLVVRRRLRRSPPVPAQTP